MRIAGEALALFGLLLLFPAMLIGSQLAVGTVNINATFLSREIIVSALGTRMRSCWLNNDDPLFSALESNAANS